MFVKSIQKKNILNVNNTTFATLLNFNSNSNNFTFEINFTVPIVELFNFNAFTVNVNVYSKLISNVKLDPQLSTVDQLKQIMIQTRLTNDSKKEFLLAKSIVDLTSYISNSDIKLLKNQIPIENIQTFKQKKIIYKNYTTLSDEEKQNIVMPMWSYKDVKNFDQLTLEDKLELKRRMFEMVFNEYKSPSDIALMNHRSATQNQLMNGLIKRSREYDFESNNAIKVLQTILNSGNNIPLNNQTMPIVANVINDSINASSTVNFTTEDYQLYIILELIDVNQQLIDSVILPINLSEYIKVYQMPIYSPNINYVHDNNGNNFIELSNFDNKTKAVNVYYRNILQNTFTNFSKATTYQVSSKNIRIPTQNTQNNAYICRVVPIGENVTTGCDFKDIVISSNNLHIQNPILTSQILDNGVQLKLSNIPDDVTSINFLVKNKTINEKIFKKISSSILIDKFTRAQNYLEFIDSNVKANYIYEYIVEFIKSNGIIKQDCYTQIEFFERKYNSLTTIKNIKTINSDSGINITFNFATQLQNSKDDDLYVLLKNRAIDDLFIEELKTNRGNLKKVLAHQIIRTNMTTGEIEYCGIFTSNNYDDVLTQQSITLKPLNKDMSYKYEVHPTVMEPEILFESYEKTISNSYKFKPSKYLHPLTLKNGILVSEIGKKTLYVKNNIAYGLIGTPAITIINLSPIDINLTNVLATRIDSTRIKITWGITGNEQCLDHVLIMKNNNNIRTIVGKIHGTLLNGGYYLNNTKGGLFIHNLTKNDFGRMYYELVPIYTNFYVGNVVNSNFVEVF